MVEEQELHTLNRAANQISIATIDRAIGKRLRDLRLEKGMTQQQMANVLGVTYQQAHKYENGLNRISAGKLAVIAEALHIPITYFYQGITNVSPEKELGDRLSMETARHFRKITNNRQREAISTLIRELAGE